MRMMEGFGDLQGDDVEPLPFIEEWQLCRHLGWSWQDCLATPQPVRELFLLALSVEAGVRKKQEQAAARGG
jgi:hypothetical protein